MSLIKNISFLRFIRSGDGHMLPLSGKDTKILQESVQERYKNPAEGAYFINFEGLRYKKGRAPGEARGRG